MIKGPPWLTLRDIRALELLVELRAKGKQFSVSGKWDGFSVSVEGFYGGPSRSLYVATYEAINKYKRFEGDSKKEKSSEH